MHQITRGSGKRLLLIHGLGSSWRGWQPILDDLAAERSVIAIDLPGHGVTPAQEDSGTFEGLVRSVERYLVANDLIGVAVVGSSMGARIVLELARRGKVGNVVALDPGGFWRGWERSSSASQLACPPSCCASCDRACRRSVAVPQHALLCWPSYLRSPRFCRPN